MIRLYCVVLAYNYVLLLFFINSFIVKKNE